MNNKIRDTQILSDLIAICVDGSTQYRNAATETDDAELEQEFRKLAEVRDALVRALTAQLENLGGKPGSGGTAAGTLEKAYTEMLAAAGVAPTEAAMPSLRRVEQRTLEAFREASDKVDVGALELLLRDKTTFVEATREHLSSLDDEIS